MLQSVVISLDEIYVPVKLRKEFDAERLERIAEAYLDKGEHSPIQVRRDEAKNRYVLVKGLHRLEALKALGEDTIEAIIVHAPRH